MSVNAKLLAFAERGRNASRASAPSRKPFAPVKQTHGVQCLECDRPLTRENAPYWVCEPCAILWCEQDGVWTRRAMPRLEAKRG